MPFRFSFLKRTMKKLTYLLIGSSILTILLFGRCSCKPSEVPQMKIVAYLPMWKMPYTPDWNRITHICLAFGKVCTDGTLDMEAVIKHRTLIDDAHRYGVKVLLSIGGGGSHSFSPVLLDETCRSTLVRELRYWMDELLLDGVDVDYEEWDGGSEGASEGDLRKQQGLEEFYRELRETIGDDKLISAAVNASWDTQGFGMYNCFNNTMHRYLDFVSLMIYDETGPWSGVHTGAHSSWDFFEHAIHHWLVNRELPAEKLVAGVPFYGYKFSRRGYANDAEGISYKDILERYPDEDAHLKDSIGLLYYDGMPTIRKKAEYVKEHQLGGIMFWEMTQDTDDEERSLIRLIHTLLK